MSKFKVGGKTVLITGGTAQDMGEFLRIPMDERDLHYAGYFSEGESAEPQIGDYDSQSTRQLSVKEIRELLMSLPEIQEELTTVGA